MITKTAIHITRLQLQSQHPYCRFNDENNGKDDENPRITIHYDNGNNDEINEDRHHTSLCDKINGIDMVLGDWLACYIISATMCVFWWTHHHHYPELLNRTNNEMIAITVLSCLALFQCSFFSHLL